MPQNLNCIEGVRLRLRLVRLGDAAYIHALRTNPAYNKHLSAVTGNVQDQRGWINEYKSREAAGCEYYFMIERLRGPVCGVVRLYDVEARNFTWGSWILDENKPSKAALESAFLLYKVAFETLELVRAVFDVRRGNKHTLSFHRRFGAREIGGDSENIYFDYTCLDFLTAKDALLSAITGDEVQ